MGGNMFYKPVLNKSNRFCASIVTFILLLILLANSVFAVSEAAVLSLLISPSPQANAMGQTYGNIAGKDPIATQFNPASLGLWAQNHYFATSYLSPDVQWLPGYGDNLTYYSRSTALGVNLKNSTGLPISYGLSFNYSKFGLDMSSLEASSILHSNYLFGDQVQSTSMALAVDYFVNASVGYTLKTITSRLASVYNAEINAYDVGVIVKAPLCKLADQCHLLPLKKLRPFRPYFNPGLYYSLANVGDKISYTNSAYGDPLPRTVSLGVNLETGIQYKINHQYLDLVSFNWAHETDDLLIKVNRDKPSEYVNGFHDIKIWDNLLLGQANDEIISKKGWQVEFANFYSYRMGKFEDPDGRVFLETQGYKINFLQPLKLLLICKSDRNFSLINTLLMNINFEYHYSRYKTTTGHPLKDTKFNGYVISLDNFPLHK